MLNGLDGPLDIRFYALLDDGWAFLVHGRVENDLGAFAITVERLLMVSRRNGRTGSAIGLVAVPERPPMMMWGRYHDYGDTASADMAADGARQGRTS